MKLGKKPARPGAVKLRLNDYLIKSQIPLMPKTFGFEQLFKPKAWGMLGNEKYGCCYFASGAHQTMLINKACGVDIQFTEANVLSDYGAATGFDPAKPDTDQGTDMQQGAKYRQQIGLADSTGKRHKIGPYAAIEPGNLEEHYYGLFLFDVVDIGIEFPDYAMDQFNAGKPWSVVKGGTTPRDGHAIPLVARRSKIECVTWGQLQGMTLGFFKKYNDESIVYLSDEMLKEGKTVRGFDLAALQQDYKALTQ